MALKNMGSIYVRARIDGGPTEGAEMVISYGGHRAIISVEGDGGSDMTLYIDDANLKMLADHLTRAANGEGDVR